MSRDVIATISKAALLHNLKRIREFAPNSSVWAMIKSNGYGHGLTRIAKTLTDVNAYGVACIEEALCLRQMGVTQPIIIMSGFVGKDEWRLFSEYQFGAVLHEPQQIEILENSEYRTAAPLWLKIDTGMNRLGFALTEVPEMHRRLQALSLTKNLGVMTHLSCADFDAEYTAQQIQKFNRVISGLSHPRSIVNSAGILNCAESHYEWVRPGILFYGVSPFKDKSAQDLGLKPVMTLRAKLIAKKEVKKGDLIGYGGAWRCKENTLVGVVAVGYGDGYPRHAESGTPVLVGNTLCPLIGRVSMDMITIDLTAHPTSALGDSVTLWGEGLPIERIAKHADTIAYELLCGVTQRVNFVEE